MKQKHQKMLLTFMFILLFCTMIFGALTPNPSIIPLFSGNSEYFHFFGFMVLTIMIFKTFELYSIKHEILIPIVTLISFSVLSEVAQIFISTRHFSYKDIIINLSGCLIGYLVYSGIFCTHKIKK